MTAQPDPLAFDRALGKARPLRHRLHSLFGLKLSLFLAFVCATGTVATVSHEIEWLLMPQVRASPTPAEPDWGAMWTAVRRAHPDAWVHGLESYDRSDVSYFAKAVPLTMADGSSRTVLMDPGSNRVSGSLPRIPFHSFMRGLHYYLFTPGDWGFFAVTALSFALAGSLVTGLLVYKRFWKGLGRRPRFERSARTWLGDVHRLSALWTLPFVLLIAATGIWYFVERIAPDWETPMPRAAALRTVPDGPTVARWAAAASAAMPGLRITAISLPWADGDPVIVQGKWRAWLVRERTDAAFIDPVSGRLLGVRAGHRLGAIERWGHTADPLHFGNFAGLAGKLAWVVFGLGLTLLAATGALVHGKRLAGHRDGGTWTSWRRSLGWAFVPSLALILAIPAWFFLSGWNNGAQEPMRAVASIETTRLWRDGDRWCAAAGGRSQMQFVLASGRRVPAAFEAGRFCADLPPGARLIKIN